MLRSEVISKVHSNVLASFTNFYICLSYVYVSWEHSFYSYYVLRKQSLEDYGDDVILETVIVFVF